LHLPGAYLFFRVLASILEPRGLFGKRKIFFQRLKIGYAVNAGPLRYHNHMKKLFFPPAIILILAISIFTQTKTDSALRLVIDKDTASRDSSGKLMTLTAAEHLYRADVYSTNRQFSQAREHWQKILDNYPTDAGMSQTLLGIARSYMWERQYEKAIYFFDLLTKDYLSTKDGREGLAFKGASYVRLGKNAEAAAVYQQYIAMFPLGERVESAHLNTIDALREAGKYQEAEIWIDKTSKRFPGMAAQVNALHAGLRMDIYRGNWNGAISRADTLLTLGNFNGAMAGSDEIKYLKGVALEKAGRRADAVSAYSTIPANVNSYYSGLAAERLEKLNPAGGHIKPISQVTPKYFTDFPTPFRTDLLRAAKTRNIDPRFVLAIMKQESTFRPNAKSPSAARGLLQLVYDTAIKYNKRAGYPNFTADDLYQPSVSIAIGSVYISDLKDQFGGLYEAIAASYNGGEDNAARWLNRSKPKEAGIFTAEIGFAETKNYVFKVMTNYRIYRELYTEDLVRK
jgi:soluble lytic murein transglycosylase